MHIEEVIRNPRLISIDSRSIKKGEIFVAIKGKNFDGHDFVKEALGKGAKFALVSKIPELPPLYRNRLIKVKDTIETLGDMAKAHRRNFNIPIIAVTGSNGKTTVKDMIAHVLSAKFNVLKSEASKNNLIGLPLTLFGLTRKHDVCVLEMGMNRLGEIDRLSEIARPHIGVITNIGPSHLEFLGSLKKVFTAKEELFRHLKEKDVAVLNKDDMYLKHTGRIKARKIYFGIKEKCRFQAKSILSRGDKWYFSLGGKERFELPLLGRHNIYNALAAISVAKELGMDFSNVSERMKSFRQACPMRLQPRRIGGITILDDSYNSNPLSMECAIRTLLEYNSGGRKIVITGDMLELGKKARCLHESLGREIASSAVDILITTGPLAKYTNLAAKKGGMKDLYHAASHVDAAKFLKKTAQTGDVVLVKGSRAMKMERVIECYTTYFTR